MVLLRETAKEISSQVMAASIGSLVDTWCHPQVIDPHSCSTPAEAYIKVVGT